MLTASVAYQEMVESRRDFERTKPSYSASPRDLTGICVRSRSARGTYCQSEKTTLPKRRASATATRPARRGRSPDSARQAAAWMAQGWRRRRIRSFAAGHSVIMGSGAPVSTVSDRTFDRRNQSSSRSHSKYQEEGLTGRLLSENHDSNVSPAWPCFRLRVESIWVQLPRTGSLGYGHHRRSGL